MPVQLPPGSLLRVLAPIYLQMLQDVFRIAPNVTLTSWYRDPLRNTQVGGDPCSQHLYGLALDLVGLTDAQVTALRSAGYVVVREGDHDHLQVLRAGTLRELGLCE